MPEMKKSERMMQVAKLIEAGTFSLWVDEF